MIGAQRIPLRKVRRENPRPGPFDLKVMGSRGLLFASHASTRGRINSSTAQRANGSAETGLMRDEGRPGWD